MDKPKIFEQLPHAVVSLAGLGALKKYLKANIHVYNGLPILNFTCKAEEVLVRYVQPNGQPCIAFFGYVDDVAHNVQCGLLEGKEEWNTDVRRS